MQRQIVSTVEMRLSDIIVGDIVNRNPADGRGWFVVDSITTIGKGRLALADAGSQNSATGKEIETISVQIVSLMEVAGPDAGAEPEVAIPAAPTPIPTPTETAGAADEGPAEEPIEVDEEAAAPRKSLFAAR